MLADEDAAVAVIGGAMRLGAAAAALVAESGSQPPASRPAEAAA